MMLFSHRSITATSLKISSLLRTCSSTALSSAFHHPLNLTHKIPTTASLIPLTRLSSSFLMSQRQPSDIENESSGSHSKREISSSAIKKHAKIVSLSDINDDANAALHKGWLPEGSTLLSVGGKLEDFDLDYLRKEEPNVLFVSHPKSRKPLAALLDELPSIEWIHTRSAGIDFVNSETFRASEVICTNAKGQFSSTLAEYTLMACSYFAKNIPRLMRQKANKSWEKYNVEELRGKTLGIIGYGDIGRACAKLAKVYGMRVVALRRNPHLSLNDPYCDVAYGNDKLNYIMAVSDYILLSAPLTEDTRGMVSREALECSKNDSVFINVGRGPIVDEDALIDCLKSGKIKGAALDVFTHEPLPLDSEFWNIDNVLLSPHNMDQTSTFMHEATEFFVKENLPRFIRGEELLNHVDKAAGY